MQRVLAEREVVFTRFMRSLEHTQIVEQDEWLTPKNAVWFVVTSRSHTLRVLFALNSNLWTRLPPEQQAEAQQRAYEELKTLADAISISCAPESLPAAAFGGSLFPLRLDKLQQMQQAAADANSPLASSRLPLFQAQSLDQNCVATDSHV